MPFEHVRRRRTARSTANPPANSAAVPGSGVITDGPSTLTSSTPIMKTCESYERPDNSIVVEVDVAKKLLVSCPYVAPVGE